MTCDPITPNLAAAQSFLELLHPWSEEGFLAITAFPGPRTYFYDLSRPTAAAEAARQACGLATNSNVYFAVGTLDQVPEQGRGKTERVIGIPGLWADVDYLHPVHVALDLPPDSAAALWILNQFPLRPSILVNTGHGFQAYWLTAQPWKLGTDAERNEAKHLSAKLQTTLRAIAAQRSWSLDNTADLARLLRLPGTLNRKEPTDLKLISYEDCSVRYTVEDLHAGVDGRRPNGTTLGISGIESAPTASKNGSEPAAPQPYPGQSRGFEGFEGFVEGGTFPEPSQGSGPVPSEGSVQGNPFAAEGAGGGPDGRGNTTGNSSSDQEIETQPPSGQRAPAADSTAGQKFPPADITAIVLGCAWMRHCHDDAGVLPEPEWYTALTILGRCMNGEALAHSWSRPYPNYSEVETRNKLAHALKDSGPITCEFVAERFRKFCKECPHRSTLSSPIVLGIGGRKVYAEEPWPKPQPLSAALQDVAPFKPELLPIVLRDRVIDVSERLQVPADFPAATLLVTMAGAVGRRAVITPMQHDNTWTVVPNLWGGLVARPGLMKSPCIKAVMAPMHELQSHAMQQYKADLEDYRRERETWEVRKASRRKRAIGRSGRDEFEESTPEEPACTRFIVNDATVEKLHEILEHNPQGILYLRDELAGWFATLDTKGRERERPFFLEGWNGDASYTVDRIGRGTLHVSISASRFLAGSSPHACNPT